MRKEALGGNIAKEVFSTSGRSYRLPASRHDAPSRIRLLIVTMPTACGLLCGAMLVTMNSALHIEHTLLFEGCFQRGCEE